jgi:hypothetical protein
LFSRKLATRYICSISDMLRWLFLELAPAGIWPGSSFCCPLLGC